MTDFYLLYFAKDADPNDKRLSLSPEKLNGAAKKGVSHYADQTGCPDHPYGGSG